MSNHGIIEECENGVVLVRLLKEYYEKEAVFAAADMFKGHYYIKIDSLGDYVGIYFSAINKNSDPCNALLSFCNEAIDQQVKRDLARQFGGLRETIYRYAFEPISRSGS